MQNIDNKKNISTAQGLRALSPVIVFVLVYLGVSVAVGDFYKMPIAVAMTIASVWALAIYRGKTLTERIDRFSAEAGQSGILYMIWVFVLAGAFSALAKGIGSIEATVGFTLSVLPAELVVPGLFLAGCFISISIGTSVGTVVALAPLAMQMAQAEGASVPLFVAAALGGAFFGDNLSFISDTTIAATRTQGTNMSAKFRANVWIAVPAALMTLALYVCLSLPGEAVAVEAPPYDPWLILPYLVVIAMALCGVNVTVVLCSGILTAGVLGIITSGEIMAIFGYMGEGIEQMGGLIVITLLAGGMLGIIKAMGGITWLLEAMTRHISGLRGAQWVIVALVGIVNVCTANNTIAIITVGELSHRISRRFGVDPRKAASLLDTASCIVQCLLPYGAQTLLAATLAGISPLAPMPYLYYPWILAGWLTLSIIFLFPKRLHRVNIP